MNARTHIARELLALPSRVREAEGAGGEMTRLRSHTNANSYVSPMRPRRRTVQQRLEAILPMLEFRRRTNRGEHQNWELPNRRRVSRMNEIARYQARVHGVAVSSVWLWYSRFVRGGYDALADRDRSDRGVSRAFQKDPDLAEFARCAYLQEGLSAVSIHKLLRHLRPGHVPAYSTLRSYLKSLPKPTAAARPRGKSPKERR